MHKIAAKKLHDKRARAKKDVNKSLPVAVLPFGDFILILACSRDYRRRIKRALDRIATVSFGSEGFILQKSVSAEAKTRVFSQVSYENVTAASLAEDVSSRLSRNLKHQTFPEIDGALVVVRLDLFHPSRDEIVTVSYDGSLSFVDYFFSGTKDSKRFSSDSCVKPSCCKEDVSGGDSPQDVLLETKEEKSDDEDEEDGGMGKALPDFEEFLSAPSSDNTVSMYDVMERFGFECAKLFGENIYLQAVQMSRPAAQAKCFDEVFQPFLSVPVPWPVFKEELQKLQKKLNDAS